MKLETLIEDIMSIENIDRKKIIKFLSDGIKNKEDEQCICEKIYRTAYKNLLPEYCDELINKMHNTERSGVIWSLEDTNNVARRLDIEFNEKTYTPEEFRTVMHMEYYEHQIPLKRSGVSLEPTGWGRLSDYALTNDKTKLIDYYFSH